MVLSFLIFKAIRILVLKFSKFRKPKAFLLMTLIGVGNLYTADDILAAYQTGFADFIALGKTVMLNPDLVALINEGRETEIETSFDWQKVEKYRYTPAMLEGTKQGLDFYPPSKNAL